MGRANHQLAFEPFFYMGYTVSLQCFQGCTGSVANALVLEKPLTLQTRCLLNAFVAQDGVMCKARVAVAQWWG